ncbi:hypothetical protein [Paenibacillus radicis (ex Xue et al. 2023)]|uniref:Uncharacterized protein n=1 Tax=Paenibacillus radicis (ex Xue et al. 2023) TaxID=2972489 RepID=A0ABT1YPJ3_9BACL|nr:hypothetical protein [Paenibacillus radicis (ex Xue et al. 2023)]MCR8633915.1 hypothetical protein [Paenibacillus radicis (ex Xue et al. 2023)]
MAIPTFSYFMNQYRGLLQSLTKEIELFSQMELDQTKKEILREVEMIEENLKLEDWEMDKSIALCCNKYSKRYIKKVVQAIKGELKV